MSASVVTDVPSIVDSDAKVVPPSQRRRRRIWIALIPLILLAAGELGSRFVLGLGDPPLSLEDEATEYRFKPGVYRRFGNTISYNNFSMRSGPLSVTPTDPREMRVLFMGDSVVNGGALTTDEDLATSQLQQRLSHAMKRPVYVGNISAGSWGPPNLAGYLRKFGWFSADMIVLVLSSHDGADSPTFERTVDVHPSFPSTSPNSALAEAILRYSPVGKMLGTTPGTTFAQLYPSPPDSQIAQRRQVCKDALEEMFRGAQERGIPVMLLIHSTRTEIAGGPQEHRDVLLDAAKKFNIRTIDLLPELKKSLSAGADPFREDDDIHPNSVGQRIIADASFEPVLHALQSRAKAP